MACQLGFGQRISVDTPAETSSLEQLILELEQKYELFFTYKQSDIDGLIVVPPKKPQELKVFLSIILKNTSLKFEIVDRKYVLLSSIAINDDASLPKETSWKLCGTVKDKLTNEPLLGASVYLKNARSGSATTTSGYFEIDVSQHIQDDSLIVSYVGYEEQKMAVKSLKNKPCTNIFLDYYQLDDDFVIVTEYLTDGILLGNHGAFVQIQPDEMGLIPGQAEPDILNTIHFLPGISSQDGTPSSISVQGGTADQNLILWEGIPIYETAHYFGMLSAFNPYIIDKVAVHTGDFGANYGGRIASVITLEAENNKSKPSEIGVGSNLIYSFLDGKWRSKNQKLSTVFSLRRSMTELWRSPAFQNISKRVQQGVLVQRIDLNRLPPNIHIDDAFYFFDTHFKLDYQLTDKDKVTAAAFYGLNDFEDHIRDDVRKQLQEDTFFSANSGLHFTWTRQWQPSFKTQLTGLYSNYNYDYGYSLLNEGTQVPDFLGKNSNFIGEKQLHFLNQWRTKQQHTLNMGYQWINYDVAFDIINNGRQDGLGQNVFLSNVHVLYTDFETNTNKNAGLKIGLRLSHFGQLSKQYLEPRIRFWRQLNDAINIHVSAGKYYQFLSQLIHFNGNRASIKTPTWVLTGSREVPVLNANHLQAGMVFRENTWLVDFQLYAKKVKGLTSLASNFDEGLSNTYHLGEATIRGLNLLVKKRWNNYKSWLSYSFKKNDHHFPTFFDTDFAASIDQPHTFKWINIWTLGQLECSLGWSISSGRPFSAISNFTIVPSNSPLGPREIVLPVSKQFNKERLAAEHQLDASLRYYFRGKQKGMLGLSFYNIYNQRNVLDRATYIDKRPGMNPKLSYNDTVNLGFTPNFVLRLEW